ncbi:unannotated protein [freshwater metagenome]|uniref:Unannotated protein n=1 Tax=freshwater metagenome TaxID=449393 RepID=A0A6J6WGW7_9ZZZZ|nr:hypothetical protein [Actinomycetota bacterium]MSX76685.1 hypothetical protein [Actinomycetota bacterium]
MALMSYLRSRSVKEGLLGGRRSWFIIGVFVWGFKLIRKMTSRSPQVVSTEVLRPGQTVSVSALEPKVRRRDR